jgi:hypothetical protein
MMLSAATLTSVVVVFVSGFAYFVYIGYQRRKLVDQLRRDGVVSPLRQKISEVMANVLYSQRSTGGAGG